MPAERKIFTSVQVQAIEALNRYVHLLNYYQISPSVQDIVLAKIKEQPPDAMIEEINCYWEETFGNDHRNGRLPKTQRRELKWYARSKP